MNKTMKKAVDQWERAITYSLETGKGKYNYCAVKDLFQAKKVIQYIRKGDYCKAYAILLDTAVDLSVPDTIFNALSDVYHGV